MNRLVGAAGLVLVSPILLVVAAILRLTEGRPVLFRQQRAGLGGVPFDVVKFRTMRSPRSPDEGDEQRITRLGAFLRASSLDELPSLWNVVRGEMNIVGPRPLPTAYTPLYTPEQARRLEVRPGLTGLLQVRGRNALSWEDKFALDTWYVEHRSLWLDLRILAQTPFAVLKARGISHPGHVSMPVFRGSQPELVSARKTSSSSDCHWVPASRTDRLRRQLVIPAISTNRHHSFRQVAFGLRSLCADLRPSAFRYYRKVSAGQELPRTALRPRAISTPLALFQKRNSLERIWGVTALRDEVDIIGFTISHLIAQGVDRILVADNNSQDGSLEALLDLAESLPVTVVSDREEGFYQAWKITRLARFAAGCGAEWVIPFDADELWVAPERSLREFLNDTELDIVKARVMDYVPQDSDDSGEPNPYIRIRHRVGESRGVKKVAFRAHRLVRVAVGNHAVRHPGRSGDGLEVRHFPNRSPEQLLRKMRQGARALVLTQQPSGIGLEWRRGAAMTPTEIAAMQGWDVPLVLDPAPYAGNSNVPEPRT